MRRPAVRAAAGLVCAALAAAACDDGSPSQEGRSVGLSGLQLRGVSDLPFSQGKSFRTLDAYLAHLERRGRSDVPYYKEIQPGVYVLKPGVRGAGAAPERRYSREELEQMYGFGHRRPASETVPASRCVPESSSAMSDRSFGARFRTLDELLAHLEKGRETDGSSYRQVDADTYELAPNWMGGPPQENWKPQRFTREQLLCRYGFIRHEAQRSL